MTHITKHKIKKAHGIKFKKKTIIIKIEIKLSIF